MLARPPRIGLRTARHPADDLGYSIRAVADDVLKQPEVQNSIGATIPIGRIGDADDLKGLALFLASPASSYITGAQIPIDGGVSLGRRPA